MNLEQWYEKLMNHLSVSEDTANTQQSTNWHQHPEDQMEKLSSKLNINQRQSPEGAKPLLIQSLRVDDIDQWALITDDELLSSMLLHVPRNQPVETSNKFKLNIAGSVGEKSARIPTSAGYVLLKLHFSFNEIRGWFLKHYAFNCID
jgi:hypothetical protein